MQGQCCTYCTHGIVFVCNRDPEQGQDLIAHNLVDDAAVRFRSFLR